MPFHGEKMIIKQIDQDSPEESIVRVEPSPALLERVVPVGKGINATVQHDSLADSPGKPVIQRALDKVAHEVSGENLVVFAGEQHVKEEVHMTVSILNGDKGCPEFRVILRYIVADLLFTSTYYLAYNADMPKAE